jgi:hypothetical protein
MNKKEQIGLFNYYFAWPPARVLLLFFKFLITKEGIQVNRATSQGISDVLIVETPDEN